MKVGDILRPVTKHLTFWWSSRCHVYFESIYNSLCIVVLTLFFLLFLFLPDIPENKLKAKSSLKPEM